MMTESKKYRCRRLWRGVLLPIVMLPLLPEIVILATSVHAGAIGCHAGGDSTCEVGPTSASEIIRIALQAAYFIGSKFADDSIVLAWLAVCFVSIILGWAQLSSRLLLGFSISLIFAFLPYFGPLLSIGHLENPKCIPNEGGIPPACVIYGGDVGNAAHDAVRLGWKSFVGAPVALGAFVLFSIFAICVHFIAKKRMASRAQSATPRRYSSS
jgi:hypothetical protein